MRTEHFCPFPRLWLVSVAILAPALGGPITLVDLGTLGGNYSTASGINRAGQVVGTSHDGLSERAFLYQNGSMTALPLAGDATWSLARAINNSGTVAGATSADGMAYRAAAWSPGSRSWYEHVVQDLGSGGGPFNSAAAVNSAGQVAGWTSNPAFQTNAFVRSGGITQTIGTLGGSISRAYGINDSGQVVGESTLANGSMRPFLYAGGTLTNLGTLGGSSASAAAINNAGDIVGTSQLAGDSATRAFLYRNGQMVNLGAPAGTSSSALGLNNTGQIVGTISTNSGPRAMIYGNGAMLDLNTLMPADSPFTELHTASGINDLGQVVGTGRAGEELHAFLLNFDELHLQPGTGSTPTFTLGFQPGQAHSVFLDPEGSRTLNLWSPNSYVQNLTLGSTKSGTAELRVRAGETLSVENQLTIQPSGRLTVGSAAAAYANEIGNGGTIELNGGSIGGRYFDNGGVVRVEAGKYGLLDLDRSYGGRIEVAGSLDIRGLFSGALNIASGGKVTGDVEILGPSNIEGTLVASYSWNSGDLQLSGTIGDMLNDGTLRTQGNFQAGNVQNQSGTVHLNGTGNMGFLSNFEGQVTLAATADVHLAGLQNNSRPQYNQYGTVTLEGGSLTVGMLENRSGASITGHGTLVDGGADWRGETTPWFLNEGMLHVQGGATSLGGTVLNRGLIEVTGTTLTLESEVVNSASGTIKNTGGTISFLSGLTNEGAYISDPADNYFSDLTVSETGYLVGGAGDRFIVSGNFTNRSQQNSKWDTSEAELAFLDGGAHVLDLLGLDLGPNGAGFRDNFSWGALRLGAGQSLTFRSPGQKRALYVRRLILDGGAAQLASIWAGGFSLYFDPSIAENAYLLNTSFRLGGGGTLAGVSTDTPEPGTLVLLATALVGAGLRRQRLIR